LSFLCHLAAGAALLSGEAMKLKNLGYDSFTEAKQA
jgi:hypothetical protein